MIEQILVLLNATEHILYAMRYSYEGLGWLVGCMAATLLLAAGILVLVQRGKRVQVRFYSFSDKGGKNNNEDSWGTAEARDIKCFIVADGLGGHRGGEIASSIAVDKVRESFLSKPGISREALLSYFKEGQKAITDYEVKNPEYSSIRTTATVLVTDGNRGIWGHIGDTRLYFFRGGRIKSLTQDHSVPQVLVAMGEIGFGDIRHHEDRNKLLRVMGDSTNFKPAIMRKAVSLRRGDAFLLCSDGFWEYVAEAEMEEDYGKSETPEKWVENMKIRLLKRVKNNNDNYTALGVYIGRRCRLKGKVLNVLEVGK